MSDTRPTGAKTVRATGLFATVDAMVRRWLGKASFTLLDQGLIGSSNFLMGILLARQLPPRVYGAYALAFEFFLLLSVVYGDAVLEPLSVFGPSVYRDSLRPYLGILLRVHFVFNLFMMLILGSAAWVAGRAGSHDLAWALAGVALATPWLLLFWLARRAFYVRLEPRLAAFASILYSVILVGGLLVAYKLRWLSPFTAFMLMAGGALVAGPVLWMRARRTLALAGTGLTLMEVGRRHWNYGRWALASSIVMWAGGGIYYPLLGAFRGLAQAGDLKALMNFASPIGQFFVALTLLSLPYASRRYHVEGAGGLKPFAWRLTAIYACGTMLYWAGLIVLKGTVVHVLYGGKYLEVMNLLPWVAAGSILRIGATAQSISLRAMHLPNQVFVAYTAAGAIAVVLGIPATWAFGLRGAVLVPIASNAAALTAGFVLLHRNLDRKQELPCPEVIQD